MHETADEMMQKRLRNLYYNANVQKGETSSCRYRIYPSEILMTDGFVVLDSVKSVADVAVAVTEPELQ